MMYITDYFSTAQLYRCTELVIAHLVWGLRLRLPSPGVGDGVPAEQPVINIDQLLTLEMQLVADADVGEGGGDLPDVRDLELLVVQVLPGVGEGGVERGPGGAHQVPPDHHNQYHHHYHHHHDVIVPDGARRGEKVDLVKRQLACDWSVSFYTEL